MSEDTSDNGGHLHVTADRPDDTDKCVFITTATVCLTLTCVPIIREKKRCAFVSVKRLALEIEEEREREREHGRMRAREAREKGAKVD